MKSRIIRIGKSRDICLPQTLLKRAQLKGDVELRAEPGRIVISKNMKPRAGWAEAARRMRAHHEDRLLAPPTSTRFDEKQWIWR